MVPVFLASSFAFIAPIQYSMKHFGVAATLGGLAVSGLMYVLFSLLIYKGGINVIERILPPVVTGPVIMVIGLNLKIIVEYEGTAYCGWQKQKTV